jgi:hypothetical protein
MSAPTIVPACRTIHAPSRGEEHVMDNMAMVTMVEGTHRVQKWTDYRISIRVYPVDQDRGSIGGYTSRALSDRLAFCIEGENTYQKSLFFLLSFAPVHIDLEYE